MAELQNINVNEVEKIKAIAGSENDHSLVMINLNQYCEDAGYPDGTLYKDYMAALDILLEQVGGEIFWRTTVLGQVIGEQVIDEALGIWYPTHQAFLNVMTAPGSAENMRLRNLAVQKADLHRSLDTFMTGSD